MHRKAQAGFTLIEMMVVVAIVTILAAVAFPAYTDYIIRSKITEATSTLSDMRVKMEQYYQDNRTYVGACAGSTVAPLPTGKYFTYTCPTLTATAYTVRADGGVSGADQSMAQFVYTIDQNNARATLGVPVAKGWSGAGASCWVQRKGGSC
jgi:type IV pilus assembly protein PilE